MRSRTCVLCRRAQSLGAAALEPFYTYVTEIDPTPGAQALLVRRALDLRIAHDEGRLSTCIAARLQLPVPQHHCGTCGMLHPEHEEALACCADMIEVTEDQRRLLRVEQEWTLA